MVLKNNWIYVALSVLIATYSAYESAWFLLLLGLLSIAGVQKGICMKTMIFIVLSGVITFHSALWHLNKIDEPLNLPAILTWSGEYKMDGAFLRGIMKDERGHRIYVSYEFPSEEEKLNFYQTSLAGKQFIVYGEMVNSKRPSHPYSFDLRAYLKSKGAKGILEIKKMEYISEKTSIVSQLHALRFKLKKHIEQTFPSSLAPEVEALIIGLQDHMDYETKRAYQKLGITHLFAISGLHVGIVAFLIYQTLLRLRVRREMATVFLLMILPMYAILAGSASSVWRAVILVELMTISQLGKKLAIHDALSLCFIGFVLLEPWVIFQIGFQLSFLATASMIYSHGILERFSTWWQTSFFVTFVCQVIVYPLLLLHFYELSISSFFVNIIFVPLFSFIILPITLLLLLISFLPSPFLNFLLMIYEPIRRWIGMLIDILQSFPYQMWTPGKPSTFLLIASYISIFLAFYFLDRKEDARRIKKAIVILSIPILFIHFQGKWNTHLQITFVDVGQGDCIVIELPFRKAVYVIDTGGVLRFGGDGWKQKKEPYEVGRQVVVPFLKGKGISEIDYLILTHADHDHVEGAEEVLREIKVKEIHITPSSLSKEVMKDVFIEAKQRNIPIKEQMAGTYWQMGEAFFQYLWPFDTQYEGNNDSLVLYMKWKEFEALFTGDLEQAGEMELMSKFPKLEGINLFKAGHHGSKTSSSEMFIQKIQPTLTIFCAGENNRYGHPHEEVVERYRALGLQTLTTGVSGTIEITVKDKGMIIRNF